MVNQPIRIMDDQKVQAIAPLLSSLEISITKQFNIFAAMRWWDFEITYSPFITWHLTCHHSFLNLNHQHPSPGLCQPSPPFCSFPLHHWMCTSQWEVSPFIDCWGGVETPWTLYTTLQDQTLIVYNKSLSFFTRNET